MQAQTLTLVGNAGALPRVNVLTGWHLLSLDAPTVAAVWMWFVARSAGVEVRAGHLAAMFLAVWMLYAADRLLDARKAEGLEARHRFHARHKVGFLVGLALAGLGLMPLVSGFSGRELRLDGLLGGLLAAWLLVVHTRGRGQRLPKELMVGVFFAAAVTVPAVAAGAEVWGSMGMFAAVCALNGLCIHAWEHPLAEEGAHAVTAFGVRYLGWLAGAIVLGAVVVRTPVAAACGLAAAALYGLGMTRTRLSRTTLRAAADLVLLTPMLFVR